MWVWNFELTTVNISWASNFVLAPIRQLHHQELAFYGNGMENIFDLVAKPSDLTSDIKVVIIITNLDDCDHDHQISAVQLFMQESIILLV